MLKSHKARKSTGKPGQRKFECFGNRAPSNAKRAWAREARRKAKSELSLQITHEAITYLIGRNA